MPAVANDASGKKVSMIEQKERGISDMVRPRAANAMVPVESIEPFILALRGQRVIIDADLARLYGVTTKRLNEQVKRNPLRFPPDFVFQLTESEVADLRSQFATSKTGAGGRRYRPYAFTEHGAIMAANVLNSQTAVKVSVLVVRAFVRLRQVLAMHHDLAKKLDELESKLQDHDGQILTLMNAIRELLTGPSSKPKPPIGFLTEQKNRKTSRRSAGKRLAGGRG
jgi:ORF6N domain